MSIRKATINDVKAIRSLIIRAVDPENNTDIDEEGLSHFYKPNEISAIKARILGKNYLTLCFFNNETIVGLITIYANEKVDQLFVDSSVRNMKIAKLLWHAARAICLRNGGSGKFWVMSSSMAVSVYQSFGFCLISNRQKKMVSLFIPWCLSLEKTVEFRPPVES